MFSCVDCKTYHGHTHDRCSVCFDLHRGNTLAPSQFMLVHEAHVPTHLAQWLRRNAPRVKILSDDQTLPGKTPPEMYATLMGWIPSSADQPDAQAWAVSAQWAAEQYDRHPKEDVHRLVHAVAPFVYDPWNMLNSRTSPAAVCYYFCGFIPRLRDKLHELWKTKFVTRRLAYAGALHNLEGCGQVDLTCDICMEIVPFGFPEGSPVHERKITVFFSCCRCKFLCCARCVKNLSRCCVCQACAFMQYTCGCPHFGDCKPVTLGGDNKVLSR